MSEQINLKTIYDIVSELEKKIDKRFDNIDNQIKAAREETQEVAEKMEKRIVPLEDFKSRSTGALAIIGIFVSGLAAFVWRKIAE